MCPWTVRSFTDLCIISKNTFYSTMWYLSLKGQCTLHYTVNAVSNSSLVCTIVTNKQSACCITLGEPCQSQTLLSKWQNKVPEMYTVDQEIQLESWKKCVHLESSAACVNKLLELILHFGNFQGQSYDMNLLVSQALSKSRTQQPAEVLALSWEYCGLSVS